MASKSWPSGCEEPLPVARAWVIPTTKSASTTPSADVTLRRIVLVLIVVSFRGYCSCGGLPSSCLLSAGNFGDEESLRLYREDEAYPAARFPSTCDVERTLDGRGGDTPLMCEDALADLDGNVYHLCTPSPRRCSRGKPLGHEIRNRILRHIDVAVVALVYPLTHTQPDRGDGILHVHHAQHLKQGAFGGELYFLGGYLHHLSSSRRGYMSLIRLLTRGPPGATRDVRRIPGVYYCALAGHGSLQGKHVISRRCVLA